MATKRKVFNFNDYDEAALKTLVGLLVKKSGLPVSQVTAVRRAIEMAIEALEGDKPAQPKYAPPREVRRVDVTDEA